MQTLSPTAQRHSACTSLNPTMGWGHQAPGLAWEPLLRSMRARPCFRTLGRTTRWAATAQQVLDTRNRALNTSSITKAGQQHIAPALGTTATRLHRLATTKRMHRLTTTNLLLLAWITTRPRCSLLGCLAWAGWEREPTSPPTHTSLLPTTGEGPSHHSQARMTTAALVPRTSSSTCLKMTVPPRCTTTAAGQVRTMGLAEAVALEHTAIGRKSRWSRGNHRRLRISRWRSRTRRTGGILARPQRGYRPWRLLGGSRTWWCQDHLLVRHLARHRIGRRHCRPHWGVRSQDGTALMNQHRRHLRRRCRRPLSKASILP